MSFILDALRKSESERQRLLGASIADLPIGQRRTQPWWAAALGLLLLVNVVLLLVVLWRPASRLNESPISNAPAAEISAQHAATPTIAAHMQSTAPSIPVNATTANIAATIQNTPHTTSLAEAAAGAPQIQYETVDRATLEAASAVPEGPTLVRSINSNSKPSNDGVMVAASPNSLADLHLDMHVYAPLQSGRFVFINNHKYTEGQTLAEGPRVEQITTEGVILSYRGTQWQMERR